MIISEMNDWSEKFELEGSTNYSGTKIGKTLDFIFEEVRETERAVARYNQAHELSDLEEIIDGFGDVAFIAINAVYKSFRLLNGQDTEQAKANTFEVLNRITKANFAKLHDGKVVKVNGKVTKPEGWQAPTYGDLL